MTSPQRWTVTWNCTQKSNLFSPEVRDSLKINSQDVAGISFSLSTEGRPFHTIWASLEGGLFHPRLLESVVFAKEAGDTICTPHACSTHGGQKRVLIPRELELQMVPELCGCRESNRDLLRGQPRLLHSNISAALIQDLIVWVLGCVPLLCLRNI